MCMTPYFSGKDLQKHLQQNPEPESPDPPGPHVLIYARQRDFPAEGYDSGEPQLRVLLLRKPQERS